MTRTTVRSRWPENCWHRRPSRLRTIKELLVVCVLATTGVACGQSQTATSPSPAVSVQAPGDSDEVATTKLISSLRSGGLTIYIRHAFTDRGPDDGQVPDSDCDRQRNLSKIGRDQAREIGQAVSALRIPVGEVIASPRCRTMETAKLAFGRATAVQDVRDGGADLPSYPRLQRLLATPIAKRVNRVVVGHGDQFKTVTSGAYELSEGETAIVQGLGGGRFKVIGRISSQQWERYAKQNPG